MTRKRDPDIDYDSAPDDDGRADNPAAAKSRALGVLFALLGAAAVAGVLVYDVPSRKVTAVLAAFGSLGVVMGAGMVLVPWTPRMFELNQQDDFGKMFAAMPLFWKAWFVLSIAVMLGAMFATLILW